MSDQLALETLKVLSSSVPNDDLGPGLTNKLRRIGTLNKVADTNGHQLGGKEAEVTVSFTADSGQDVERALEETRRWIEACTEEVFPHPDYRLSLRDGHLLCKLANAIQPGIIKNKIRRTHTSFVWLENLNYFINACKEFGLEGSQLFNPVNLVVDSEQRTELEVLRGSRDVAVTLFWLGKKANQNKTFEGPKLDLNEFGDLVGDVRQDDDDESPNQEGFFPSPPPEEDCSFELKQKPLEETKPEHEAKVELQDSPELKHDEKTDAAEVELQDSLKPECNENTGAAEVELQDSPKLERDEKTDAAEVELQDSPKPERDEKTDAAEVELQDSPKPERDEKTDAAEVELQDRPKLECGEKTEATKVELQDSPKLECGEKTEAAEVKLQDSPKLECDEKTETIEVELQDSPKLECDEKTEATKVELQDSPKLECGEKTEAAEVKLQDSPKLECDEKTEAAEVKLQDSPKLEHDEKTGLACPVLIVSSTSSHNMEKAAQTENFHAQKSEQEELPAPVEELKVESELGSDLEPETEPEYVLMKQPPLGYREVEVVMVKEEGKAIGFTVREKELGEVVVCRLLEKARTISEDALRHGDFLKTINGEQVSSFGQAMKLLGKVPPGNVVLTVYQNMCNTGPGSKKKMYVRALFDYDHTADELLPCKEAGLSFKKGDILHILNQEDPDWWQASKICHLQENCELAHLIPSMKLQEKRVQPIRVRYSHHEVNSEVKSKQKRSMRASMRKMSRAFIPSKKTSKSIYDIQLHGTEAGVKDKDYDVVEWPTYDQVALVDPNRKKPRPIVLVGLDTSDCDRLRTKVIEQQPKRFAIPVPHTTRDPRPGEVDDVVYHFIKREEFLRLIVQHEFFEHGKLNGNYYGTSLGAIRAIVNDGKICVIPVRIEAVRSLKNSCLQPLVIFIQPDLTVRETEHGSPMPSRKKARAVSISEGSLVTDTPVSDSNCTIDINDKKAHDQATDGETDTTSGENSLDKTSSEMELVERVRINDEINKLLELHGHLFDEIIVNTNDSSSVEKFFKIAQRTVTEPQWTCISL